MAGILREFGPGIWIADGPTVTAAAGFHYPTRMAVIRLSSGGLFVWSPTALTDALRAEVDALGEVRFLIAPNSLHHVFLADWQRGYSGAGVYAAPGLREKRRDIRFDGDLGDMADADWAGDLDQVVMRGNRITTEVVFFHRRSKTVLFTDLIQHFRPGWFKGWRALVARLDLMVAAEPSVPRKFRAAFTDRPAARAAIERILAWPAEKVLMAHGEPVTEGAQAFLRRAFRWLVRS
ncbi:MAG: DUF4336 domain-containing protein [Mesorhizobium sp.]|uniref:DUF4336 domain-containing protein n=1 Tax=Mesorhizobium sp. TaxID=1871066 RepID=UPI001AC55798|nr:DUF4336 domain-containing protein [Mesorhizobium sp.]MBN9220664.1 DUF4336 domain-containing protein [Mesorhizobium sp.]